MTYNLGEYRWKNFKIYKKVWWFFYECINNGPYSREMGVRKVNELCGIKGEETDYSRLILLPISNDISGRFLTNFKKVIYNYHPNDPLPAEIKPYKGVLTIQWDNGQSCVIDASHINIYKKNTTPDCIHFRNEDASCKIGINGGYCLPTWEGIDCERITDGQGEPMMKHKIKWGGPPLGRELTEEEIQTLLRMLDKRAEDCNVFHIDLIPAEIKHIEENVKNAHLIQVNDDTNDGSIWCVVGANETSTKREFNRI